MKKMQNKKPRLTIRTKLIFVTALLLIIPVLALGIVSYFVAKSELENSGKILLKNSVEMTLLEIETNQALVDSGKLTLEEAQERVREFMLGKKQADGTRPINKNFDLGDNGYLLAYTQEGVEAAHPSLEGKNVWEVADKKTGMLLVQEQIKAGNNGGGYVTYWWTLPKSEVLAQKITYQKTDPHWKWVVSAGTYMSDFNKGSNAILGSTLIILLFILIIGSGIIVIFANHIAGPIKKISKAVDVVASGDLTQHDLKINNRDEIGLLYHSFNTMVKNVNELISSVKNSAITVLGSSEELDKIVESSKTSINQVAITVEEIAKSSTLQAEETQNGANRVRNLADRIEYVTGLSVKTDKTAAAASSLRGKGMQAIESVSSKSEDNQKAAEKANQIIMEMDKNSVEIGSITEAISQISEQTNLLSLNAAIEAARAGEQGKGFAVVAEEIRKLASQSAISAAKVRELINGIQSKSQSAVKAMEEGTSLAKEQNAAVLEAKAVFSEILTAIDNMAADVQSIKSYSVEMEHEKNEIVGILETLSASTEENSAATEEVSAATTEQLVGIDKIVLNTQELKKLAEDLRRYSDAFKV